MAKPTIVTRAGKGAGLTWAEGDANFTNLQTAAVPDGGLPGEYLVKNTTTNWDFGWTDRVNAKTIYETVKNVSGGSLAKGTPVYQIGVTGNTITVAAARADDPGKLAVGMLDETIADAAEGRMLVLGEIKGVNTAGFTTGDKVYLGATGGYTNVKPTGSGVAVQFLGVVFRISDTQGSGYITGTLSEDSIKYSSGSFYGWTGTAWELLELQGPQGAQGIQGVQGITGSQGIQGITGEQGIQGITGAQGIQGIKGEDGIIGVNGEQGIQGIQGITGDSGTPGEAGSQGIQGIQGITGDSGTPGEAGAQGIQGIQGITGSGSQGIQGIQGIIGNQGIQGIQGLSGGGGGSSGFEQTFLLMGA